MGNRRSYCKLEIFRRLLFMIKGFHIGWHSFKLVFCKLRFIKECVENSMFNCSKHGFAYILVFFTEWLVNNPNSAVSVDRKAYQNSDCWQVSFNKIWSTIQRINPHNSIFGFKRIKRYRIINLSIIRIFNNLKEFSSFFLIAVQKFLANKVFRDMRRCNYSFEFINGLLRLFPLNFKSWVKDFQIFFNVLLNL